MRWLASRYSYAPRVRDFRSRRSRNPRSCIPPRNFEAVVVWIRRARETSVAIRHSPADRYRRIGRLCCPLSRVTASENACSSIESTPVYRP